MDYRTLGDFSGVIRPNITVADNTTGADLILLASPYPWSVSTVMRGTISPSTLRNAPQRAGTAQRKVAMSMPG